MIYAENQNVKTTRYQPPEGEAGRRYAGQYQRQAKPAPSPAAPNAITRSETQASPVQAMQQNENRIMPITANSVPKQEPKPETPWQPSSSPAEDTLDMSSKASPAADTSGLHLSEWADPPESEYPQEQAPSPQQAPSEIPGASSFPERQGETAPGETLEQYEQDLEALEGGPISTDEITAIPDLTPPGLTPEQASEYADYYEDASELRDAQPGPAAEERASTPPQEAPLDSAGTILVQVFTAREALPIADARVTITHGPADNRELIGVSMTDRDGRTRAISVPAPAKALSEAPSPENIVPFATYDITVEKPHYYTVIIHNVQVFGEENTLQGVDMTPLAEFEQGTPTESFTVLPQNL